MKWIEAVAIRFLRSRGYNILPIGWRGLAVGGHGTAAFCNDYDNTKFSTFRVDLAPHSQLIAVNHTIITCPQAQLDVAVNMEGAASL